VKRNGTASRGSEDDGMKARWKLKALDNGAKMRRMAEKWRGGLGYSGLEKMFRLPRRNGCNARDLLIAWEGRPEAMALAAPTGAKALAIQVAPEEGREVLLPPGAAPGSDEAVEAVARARAPILRVSPKDMTPNRMRDLYQDAVQRGLVRGVKPAKVSAAEVEAAERTRSAKVENARLVSLARMWFLSSK
jgi:hypothetical protein